MTRCTLLPWRTVSSWRSSAACWLPVRPRARSSTPVSALPRPTSETSRACSRAFDSARPLTFDLSVCIRNMPSRTIGTRQTTPNSTSHLRCWKKLMFIGLVLDRPRGPSALLAMSGGRDGVLRRRRGHVRVLDLAEALHERVPLARLQNRLRLAAELRVLAEERVEADVDVVGVVRQRHRVAAVVEQRDDLVRLNRALELHQSLDGLLGHVAGALVAVDRHAVDRRDVDRVAGPVLGHVARRGHLAVARLEAAHGGLEARLGEVGEHDEHAAVDLAGGDVLAAARVDRDARVAQHALGEQRLREQHDLADREVAVAVEDVAALGAVDGGRLEQLPAVEERLRVDLRSALAGRLDLERDVRLGGTLALADAPEDRAADDVRALLEALQRGVLRVQAERLREVVVIAARGRRLALEDLVHAAVALRGGALRVGEEALLHRGDARAGGLV